MRNYNYKITWDEDEQEYRGTCDHEHYRHLSHFDKLPVRALIGIIDLVSDVDRQREEVE